MEERRKREIQERQEGILSKSTGLGVREIWIPVLILLFTYFFKLYAIAFLATSLLVTMGVIIPTS